VRIINYGLMLGLLAACSGQARADDSVASEIQALKAKLKELQQKVDSEARKTRQVEAAQSSQRSQSIHITRRRLMETWAMMMLDLNLAAGAP